MSLPISMYRLVHHSLPAMYLNRATTNIKAERLSVKFPTTRVLLRISRLIRSIGLLVRMHLQCSRGKEVYVSVSRIPSSTVLVSVESFITLSFSIICSALAIHASRSSWTWIAFSTGYDNKLFPLFIGFTFPFLGVQVILEISRLFPVQEICLPSSFTGTIRTRSIEE